MGKSDTSPEAQEVLNELYRKMSAAKKMELIFDACRTGQVLAMAGIKMQYPEATEEEVWHIWAKRHLGEKLYNEVYGSRKDV